ncbi:hypothetical protein NXV57_07605 [Bacteroides thetaiotaomicron]|nr:hypothetical protein [Bacteroides thetaiotaomicron]
MFKEHVSLQSFLRQPKYMTKKDYTLKTKKMKQFRILSMLMIVLISSLSFVSCGDDDDETSGDFSASIAGVYTGKLKVGTNVTD